MASSIVITSLCRLDYLREDALCADIGCVVVNGAELLYPDQMDLLNDWVKRHKWDHGADKQVKCVC